jgi:hypothetical protein
MVPGAPSPFIASMTIILSASSHADMDFKMEVPTSITFVSGGKASPCRRRAALSSCS